MWIDTPEIANHKRPPGILIVCFLFVSMETMEIDPCLPIHAHLVPSFWDAGHLRLVSLPVSNIQLNKSHLGPSPGVYIGSKISGLFAD